MGKKYSNYVKKAQSKSLHYISHHVSHYLIIYNVLVYLVNAGLFTISLWHFNSNTSVLMLTREKRSDRLRSASRLTAVFFLCWNSSSLVHALGGSNLNFQTEFLITDYDVKHERMCVSFYVAGCGNSNTLLLTLRYILGS